MNSNFNAPHPYFPNLPILPNLPKELNRLLCAVAQRTQTSPEMGLGISMATASAVLAAKFSVEVSEDYIEELNTFWMTVADASARKGSVEKQLMAALTCIVDQHNSAIESQRQRQFHEHKTVEGLLKSLKRRLAYALPEEAQKIEQEIGELQSSLSHLEPVAKMACQDASIEALLDVMATQKGERMLIADSESDLLDRLAFDKKLRSRILQLYSNERIDIIRRTAADVHLEHPRLTLSLTMQPSILKQYSKNQWFWDQGFLPRCALIWGVDMAGHRTQNIPSVDRESMAWWEERLHFLFHYPWNEEAGRATPHKLHFEPDAAELISRYTLMLDQAILGEYATIKEWAGKAHGLMIKLAGMFHCLMSTDPMACGIACESVEQAKSVVAWLAPQMMVTHEIFFPDLVKQARDKILRWLWSNSRWGNFTQRDVCLSVNLKADVAHKALLLLVQQGVIFQVQNALWGKKQIEFSVNDGVLTNVMFPNMLSYGVTASLF
jgi:hypothetical protein